MTRKCTFEYKVSIYKTIGIKWKINLKYNTLNNIYLINKKTYNFYTDVKYYCTTLGSRLYIIFPKDLIKSVSLWSSINWCLSKFTEQVKKKQIFSGVPQGFILGPELLIMFINITYVNNRTFYEHDTKCIIKS